MRNDAMSRNWHPQHSASSRQQSQLPNRWAAVSCRSESGKEGRSLRTRSAPASSAFRNAALVAGFNRSLPSAELKNPHRMSGGMFSSPRQAAGPYPRFGSDTSSAPAFRAIVAVASVLPLSTTRTRATPWTRHWGTTRATLAKLYPLVLAPLLLVCWWRRLRGQVVLLAALFAALRLGGYAALPTNPSAHAASALDQVAAASTSPPVTPNHSSFYGLGEFLRRWEINDLLFSIVYENLRPVSDGQQSPAQTWYVFTPAGTRERANRVLQSVARNATPELVRLNLPFLFAQTLMAAIMLALYRRA